MNSMCSIGYCLNAITLTISLRLQRHDCTLSANTDRRNFIHTVFSERELTFTFAICYRPSVCLSVCRLSSVVCM